MEKYLICEHFEVKLVRTIKILISGSENFVEKIIILLTLSGFSRLAAWVQAMRGSTLEELTSSFGGRAKLMAVR